MKRCPRCDETKPYSAFSVSTANRDGYHGHCKQCVSERHKEIYAARGKASWMTESQCTRCERLLPKTMFAKHGRTCHECLAFETEQHAKDLKQCNDCMQWLPHDAFHPSRLHIYRTSCKECARGMHARRFDKRREHALKKEYGITLAQYDELVVKQGGKCPVCGIVFEPGNRSYAVDHAHSGVHEGRIRAIVHSNCNRHVLWSHEDSAQLRAAADLIDNPLTDWYVPAKPYNQARSERNRK